MVRNGLLPLLLGLLLAPRAGLAQATALERLNALFAGGVELRIDQAQRLIVDVRDATGRYRQDVVPLSSIDPGSIRFSFVEDAVILGCRAEHGRCFRSELFKQSSVRHLGRCNLPRPPEDDGGRAVVEALQALLAEHATLAAETRTPDGRMK